MDNRNDLQWRPEDWQHTVGHLRRAERILFLKTWGLGAAIVGTAATGVVLTVGEDLIPPSETPATKEVPSVVVSPPTAGAEITGAERDAVAASQPDVVTWEAATDAESTAPMEANVPSQASPSSDAIATADGQATAATAPARDARTPISDASPETFSEASSDITSETPSAAHLSTSLAPPIASSSDNEPVERALETNATEAEFESLASEEVATFQRANFEGANSDLMPLRLRIPGEDMALDLANSLVDGAWEVLPVQSREIPWRVSLEGSAQALAVDVPISLGRTGLVRWEAACGLSWTSKEVAWYAWHPGPVFGDDAELRRVQSDAGLLAQGMLSALYALNYRLEMGVTLGLQNDLTRRMDVGVWNEDAGDWMELESSGVWGLVTEYQPMQWKTGLRVDWAVVPEWKAVFQAGWAARSDAQMQQVGIQSEGAQPFWFQMGIQR